MEAFAAVILAGGAAVRLDGADKATVEYAGQPLLAHALAAVRGARSVVVAGPPVPAAPPVRFVREDPPSGGPVAGLYAGLAATDPSIGLVVVLAVDMPRVTAETVARLVDAAAAADGSVLVGDDGRVHLAAALRRERLEEVRPANGGQDWSWRRLVGLLEVISVPAVLTEAHDVDTWDDLSS